MERLVIESFFKPLEMVKKENPMDNIITICSSSEDSSSSAAPSLNKNGRGEEEFEEEDMMTIHDYFSHPRPTQCTPNPPSMVVVDSVAGSTSYSQKRMSSDQSKAKSCAIERAKEVQENLDPQYPSFLKSMLPSQVSGGFWVGLPPNFCKIHLPKQDAEITLIFENQKVYQVKYFAERAALSRGWRFFSTENKLVEGDVLIFHLINPTAFQVYIVKAYSNVETNGLLARVNLDAPVRRQKAFKLDALHQSRSVSEEDRSEVMEGRVSETSVGFKDMKNLESFSVSVNGVNIDVELSKEVRIKYYNLCTTQNDFLHKNLFEGMNSKMAAGVISQTVDVADAIRATKLSTSKEEFAEWNKSLDALEKLGMNVCFLRAHVEKLLSLVIESEEIVDPKKYEEAIIGRELLKDEIRAVEEKLAELEETSNRFDSEIRSFREKARSNQLKFQEVADAPWSSC